MVLIFLSHAGGSARSYSSFRRYLPKELKVVTMELSGRFSRPGDPLLETVEECAADLIERHRELLANEEYAIFGHSMGTVTACELVRQARAGGLRMPVHVFFSGKNPPDEKVKCFEDIAKAPDEEIIGFFSRNTLSSAVPVPDPELMKELNKLLCTDVRMAERYSVTPEEVGLECDITVFYGRDDVMMQGVDMSSWQRFTTGKCEVIGFSGGHFYYNEHKEEVCRIIERAL